jgi:hypothetical protein
LLGLKLRYNGYGMRTHKNVINNRTLSMQTGFCVTNSFLKVKDCSKMDRAETESYKTRRQNHISKDCDRVIMRYNP